MFSSISLPLSPLKAIELYSSIQGRFDFISYPYMRPLSTECLHTCTLIYRGIHNFWTQNQVDNKIRINSCSEPSQMRLDNSFQRSQVAILVLSSLMEIRTLLLIRVWVVLWVVPKSSFWGGKMNDH